MNNKLYNNILYSIDNEIKHAINEQFNANDLDFSDDEHNYTTNIFNKIPVNIQEVYDKLVNKEIPHEYDIKFLNDMVSVIKVKDWIPLAQIVSCYLTNFPDDSLNWLDVSDILNMSYLFKGWDKNHNTYNGDISKWDVSNVWDMSAMFKGAHITSDISNWDVHNVRNMHSMFHESDFNQDISKWDVHNVKNMGYMFSENYSFNQDISRWDVSNVTNMCGMFAKSNFNQDISRWDMSNVKNTNSMFYESAFNQDISRWDMSNVENTESMFENSKFSHDITNWTLKNVKYYDNMITNCPLGNKYYTIKCVTIRKK